MKKFLKNLLAITLIILIIFFISASSSNTSKAFDIVSTIGVSILENGKVVADRSYDSENDKWNETSELLLTEISR